MLWNKPGVWTSNTLAVPCMIAPCIILKYGFFWVSYNILVLLKFKQKNRSFFIPCRFILLACLKVLNFLNQFYFRFCAQNCLPHKYGLLGNLRSPLEFWIFKVHLWVLNFLPPYTVPGHKSLSAGSFLKQNYPKYRLCERDMGGSFLL